MAPRFVQSVLQDMLSNLSKEDYSRFWRALLDRPENVRRVWVEGRDYIDLAMFMVSFFTEPLALEVAAQTLNAIDCNETAAVLRLQEVKWKRQEYLKFCKNLKNIRCSQ